MAQVPSSEEPGRPAQRFVQQTAPKAKPAETIHLPSSVPPSGAASITLKVASVQVVGSTVYSANDFQELTSGIEGKTVTLAAIYDLARQITAKYGNDGYVLSRAMVPPQDLDPKGATVTLKVIEGYVDAVQWPDSLGKYRDFFSDYATRITAEHPANIKTIERYLLLAGDLPGISVTSRFQASATNPDASTLIVEAKEKHLDAWAQVDNHGTEARGPWEFDLGATFNNIAHMHEALTVSLAGTTQLKELKYVSLGYKQVLNSEGLQAFGDVSYSWGAPGTATLEALDFKSKSLSADFGFSYPVIRSRDRNLTLSALMFMSDNEGDMLGSVSSLDRLRGIRVKADADIADNFNGINQMNLTLSHGFVGLGSTTNNNPDASRENGRVDFTTLRASVNRTQRLGKGFSYKAAIDGQYAFTPLLSPEECGYGGKDMGRAFDPSEITGDSCISVSGELRFDPSLPNNPLKTTQLYGFVDFGQIYRIDPSVGTDKTASGSSAGVGLRLGTDNWNADLSATKPLSGRDDRDWRFFLTTGASY
ncbi:MAG TPA: ShlB/FhaC/HecB family hemolysin secretion/activation protein [Devosiaceae bacterium]